MNARLSARWLSVALLVCPLAAWAQTADSGYLRGALSGRVLFEADNRAAEGVKVTLSLSSGPLVATVFTSSNGLFEVPWLSSAIYIIVVEEPGYEPIREAVQMDISARPAVLLYLKRTNSALSSQASYAVSVRELSIPPKARKAFQKGIERWAKKDPAGTLAHFQRAVAELPSYYEAYYQMGLVYMRLGRAAEAEQAFQKAIDLSQSRYPLALFGLASLLSENDRFSEAEPLARRGLELEGNSWYGQFELARALMGLHQVDAAEKSAHEARTLKRDFAPLHLVLANIHIRKGNYPALLQDLDTYLKLEPKSPASEQARQMREKVRHVLANAPNAPPAQPPKP